MTGAYRMWCALPRCPVGRTAITGAYGMWCALPRCPAGRTAMTGAYGVWCALSGWPDGHNGCLWDVVCPVQTPRSHSAVLAPCGACVPCPEAHRQPVSTRFGCPAYRTRFGCSAYRTRYGRPAIRTRTLAWGLWGVYNRAAMSKTQKLTKKDDDHAAKTHS